MSALDALREAVAGGEAAILVRVERAEGSTPRERGAAMLVTRSETAGTVGGGALEMEATLEARRMLAEGRERSRLDVPLGPAIGQCCGGRVLLDLRRGDAALLTAMERETGAERDARPAVIVFGAGHTGQALAAALAPLPFRTTVVDTRPECLAGLPDGVSRVATPLPESEIDRAAHGSAFVVMTHDHALDFILAARALERGDAAYVGMIGSATKREKFVRHLRETGSAADPARLVLPIGGAALRDKRPEVIAALTAAELIVAFGALENRCTGFAQTSTQCNKGAPDARPVREAEPHAATS